MVTPVTCDRCARAGTKRPDGRPQLGLMCHVSGGGRKKERNVASRMPTFQTSNGQLFGLQWAQPIG